MKKVLVANRGEIALRVMQACREEGLTTVAIFMDGEESSIPVRYADESIKLISDQPIAYLDIQAVIRAAIATASDAVHPGYGFLAENSAFATACQKAGLVFIGPPAPAIAIMGDKVKARETAIAAGVPVVPGSAGELDVAGAISFASETGYPIALKAAGGGGGRGFRVVHAEAEMSRAFSSASEEAQRYFGNPVIYGENYLQRPRHIEIQILADTHGNVLGLGERDCSIQRRHQKLIEESPSPVMNPQLRSRMNEAAVRLASKVGYVGAGTIEFLVADNEFFFLEMNTRIQVEHPITEQVTGVDLVREQLRIAAGAPLSFTTAPDMRGHAIECRINAEDPARDFAPSPGTLTMFNPPTGFGVRVDAGVRTGSAVDPRFDNLIAKLVVAGQNRQEALSRLSRALDDFKVSGVATTIPLFKLLIRQPDFQEGVYHTGYLEQSGLADLLTPHEPESPRDDISDESVTVMVNGRRYQVTLPAELSSRTAGSSQPKRRSLQNRSAPAGHQAAELTSPIQGTVTSVHTESGADIETGQLICIIEAMKMENEIVAHRSGSITSLAVEPGQTIGSGDLIVMIEDPSPEIS